MMKRIGIVLLITTAACNSCTGASPPSTRPHPPLPVAKPVMSPVDALPPFIKFPDQQFALFAPVEYRLVSRKQSVTIPAGFVTDFASIPEWLRPLFSHDDIHDMPGLVHDFLYWTQTCKRAEADRILRDALRDMGVSYVERQAMYWGVLLGADGAWRQNRKEREERLPRIIPPDHMKIPLNTTWRDYRHRLRDQKAALDVPESNASFCSSDD